MPNLSAYSRSSSTCASTVHPAMQLNAIVYFGRQSEKLETISLCNDLICKLQVIQRWKYSHSDTLTSVCVEMSFDMSRMIPR
mmetsp:Transcript_18035/g.25961  ORF Transcript_18035/g.25961 Transcript_18035/m.25961 type:complete len:82 (+) Transcript_18035:101-346(+)